MTLPTQLWDEHGLELDTNSYGYLLDNARVPRKDLLLLMAATASAHATLTGLAVELADKMNPETMERIQKVHERLIALGCGPEWLEQH